MAEAKVIQFGGDVSITEFDFDDNILLNNLLNIKILSKSRVVVKNIVSYANNPLTTQINITKKYTDTSEVLKIKISKILNLSEDFK